MLKNNLKLLAIDPGTREMGIAFFEKGKLIHYGVKVINRKKSPRKTLKEGRKVILRLIKDFKLQVLVAEKSFFVQSRNLALLSVFRLLRNCTKAPGRN